MKKNVKRGGAGQYEKFPYLPHPTPSFNFLNGTGMGIIFNKRGGVGMGATYPKPTLLSFLYTDKEPKLWK